MVDAVDRQMTLLGLIRKNDLVKNFKSSLYFLLRSLTFFLFNLLHFFDQVRKYSVAKTFKKKIDLGQTANSSYIKSFYVGMVPRLNNFLRTSFDTQGLGNIIRSPQRQQGNWPCFL